MYCGTRAGISNVKDFFVINRSLASVTIILNTNQLQSDASDLTERAAFLFGLGSVKIRKCSHYSVQFRFALAILKSTV